MGGKGWKWEFGEALRWLFRLINDTKTGISSDGNLGLNSRVSHRWLLRCGFESANPSADPYTRLKEANDVPQNRDFPITSPHLTRREPPSLLRDSASRWRSSDGSWSLSAEVVSVKVRDSVRGSGDVVECSSEALTFGPSAMRWRIRH
jgi:hypothetical protein